MTTLLIVKILHVLAASVWLGAGLQTAGDIRNNLGAGPEHVAGLLRRLRTTARIMNSSALFTIISGMLLIMLGAGFADTEMRYYVGVFLTALTYAAGHWMIRPLIPQIANGVNEPLSNEKARELSARFSFAVNTEHVLRLLTLVLMVYPVAIVK